MRRPRSRTAAILRKELLHIRRDTRSLIVAVLMPVALLLIYGYGVSSDIKNIRLGVADWSDTRESRELIGAFTNSGYFRVVRRSDRYQDLHRALDRREIGVALIVPTGFARDLARGRPVRVQMLVDGTDPNTATVASGYADGIIQSRSAALGREWAVRHGQPFPRGAPPIDARVRVLYNENLRSADFLVPGLIAVILAMTSALLTSGTIAGERERGTIEQLVASPLRARELVLGKIAAYSLISFVNVLLVVLVGTLLFQAPLRGSLLLLMLASAVFLMAALGQGLMLSARMPTQQTAITAALMTTMVPSVLLSGFYFPIPSMPLPIQWFTAIIPAKYFMVITRGIFLKGVGLPELWPQLVMLALYSLLILSAGMRAFKKTL